MMKMFVSDFDHTLFVDQTISQDNIHLIKSCQEKGIFVIATGRSLHSLLDALEPFSIHPDYLILNNGAMIKSVLYTHRFLMNEPETKVKELLEHFEIKRFRVLNGYGEKGLHQMTPIDWQKGICSFYLNFHDRNEKEKTYRYIKKWKDVDVLQEGLNLDILAKSVDKKEAVSYIARDLGIQKSDIFTVGDGYNDVKMVEAFQGVLLPSNDPQNHERFYNILKNLM